jgi:HPt (histidine-containing phosphotransfer) domain-containing protein
MEQTSDFDTNTLLKLKNDVGTESLWRLVSKAHEGLLKTIAALDTQIADADWAGCFHSLHTLRSTLATVGLKKQADYAEPLELQCKNPGPDLTAEDLKVYVDILRDIDVRIMPDLKAFCEQLE